MIISNLWVLFYTFLKIGFLGFGGGYAMMSMILIECEKLSITLSQFADLNVLDMIVPGPIAINAATYVGYLHSGFWGSVAATLGVALPSFVIVIIVMHFIEKYRKNTVLDGILTGIKPAAVGLIAAAALMITKGIVFAPDTTLATFSANPIGSISILLAGVFVVTAVANIKFKINPIILTLIAGVIGAIFYR